jgi:hypothetical protein
MSHGYGKEAHSVGLSIEEAHQGLDKPIKGLPLPALRWEDWHVDVQTDPLTVIKTERIEYVDIISRNPGILRLEIAQQPDGPLDSDKEPSVWRYRIKASVLTITEDGETFTKAAIITSGEREYKPFKFTWSSFAEARNEAERFARQWLTDHRKVIRLT